MNKQREYIQFHQLRKCQLQYVLITLSHPPPERTTWQNAAKRLISQNNNLPFSTRGVSESIRALAIIEEEKAVQRRKFIEESYEIFIQTTTDIKAVPVDIWLTIFNSLNVIELGRFLLSCTFFSK